MKEGLSKVAGWIGRPVAILALLLGVGAIGAALALAVDGGGSGEPTRFQQLAERSGDAEGQGDGEKSHEKGESGEAREGAGGPHDEFGGPGGLPEDFERISEEFGRLSDELEAFSSCLEENGVERPGGFGFGFGTGPGFHGFFGGEHDADPPREDRSGASFEPVHFRGERGPGFGLGGEFGFERGGGGSRFGPGGGERGGEFDFDALQQGFEACVEHLPEGLREPFNNRQERFDERQQNRGVFEDCLQEQGVGPEGEPRRGELSDEADIDRLRDAFEQCHDELGGPSGGPNR